MREIKFRAWSDGKMGEAFNPFDAQFLSSGGTFSQEAIFMQFTGLKDNNDKDIFEGDIVKYSLDQLDPKDGKVEYIEDVKFEEGGFNVDGYAPVGAFNSEMEIIGNIYETPELLK